MCTAARSPLGVSSSASHPILPPPHPSPTSPSPPHPPLVPSPPLPPFSPCLLSPPPHPLRVLWPRLAPPLPRGLPPPPPLRPPPSQGSRQPRAVCTRRAVPPVAAPAAAAAGDGDGGEGAGAGTSAGPCWTVALHVVGRVLTMWVGGEGVWVSGLVCGSVGG